MSLLEGKVAVVTGGASGIGAETARALGSEGATVFIWDIDTSGGDVAQSIRDGRFFVCDVASATDVQRACRQVEQECGRLDVLVANAGLAASAPMREMTEEFWDRILAVNLKGVWLTCWTALPLMVASGGGSIVTTASQLGLVGSRGFAAYGAAKAGVINLTRCIAAEYADEGIRANALCPGPIDTQGTRKLFERDDNPEQALAQTVGRTVLGRLGTPAEIASAVVYLASDMAAYMTGATLVVDGGYTSV